MSLTMKDFLDDIRRQGAERNMDFAYVYKRNMDTLDAVEAKVIWIEPGKFPGEFPPTTTADDRSHGLGWDTAWRIERCGIQPRPTTINIKVGKFLPGGMPDIEIPS